MTAVTPVLDLMLNLIIDANIVLVLAYCLWRLVQAVLVQTTLKSDYALQLKLLRTVLVLVIFSPVLSFLLVSLSQSVWPQAPITVSDLAVASFLRGEIALPALQFETLLNTRSQFIDGFLAGQSPWLTAAAVALIAGSLALMVRTAMTIRMIKGIVTDSFAWRRTALTDIRLSDTVSVPFATRGLFRRYVVLPTSLLTSPTQLKIVLAHEFEHLRQRDVEWEMAFEFLKPVLYFNPVFHLWQNAFGRLRELNCDQAVLENLRITPRAYADCLLEFCNRTQAGISVKSFNVALIRNGSVAARSALEARLLALAQKRIAASCWQMFVGLSLVLALGVVLAAASVRNPGDWSQDRLMLSTIVNLERLEAINRGF